jgi:hypothetical protein
MKAHSAYITVPAWRLFMDSLAYGIESYFGALRNC